MAPNTHALALPPQFLFRPSAEEDIVISGYQG